MGFFDFVGGIVDSVTSGIREFASGVVAGVSSICSSIGGGIMRTISEGASSFLGFMQDILPPGMRIAVEIVKVVINVVSTLAEILVDKPREETPEELGMKAQLCTEQENLTPDDFESMDAYIKYIRENYEVKQENIDELSDVDRQSYAMVGTGIYVKEMEEKYGIEFEPGFWWDVHRTDMDPQVTAQMVRHMQNDGIDRATGFADVLKVQDAETREQMPMGSALENAVKDVEHVQTQEEIDAKVDELRQKMDTYDVELEKLRERIDQNNMAEG